MLSFPENIPLILRAVKETQAKKILDCGPGYGKYGLLVREQYLSAKAELGELIPTDDMRLIGCELTEYFVKRPSLAAIYDDVWPTDFMKIPDHDLMGIELVMMIDIVEHHDKEPVLDFIRRAAAAGAQILVSTPRRTVMYEQHFYGDPHHHKTQWLPGDFNEFEMRDYSNDQSWIVMLEKRG